MLSFQWIGNPSNAPSEKVTCTLLLTLKDYKYIAESHIEGYLKNKTLRKKIICLQHI